jgi:hypothetical protein
MSRHVEFLLWTFKKVHVAKFCLVLLLKMALESPINLNVATKLEFLANLETILGLIGIVLLLNVQFFSIKFFNI